MEKRNDFAIISMDFAMENFILDGLTKREAYFITLEIEEEFPWLFDEECESIPELEEEAEKYLSYYEKLIERYEIEY